MAMVLPATVFLLVVLAGDCSSFATVMNGLQDGVVYAPKHPPPPGLLIAGKPGENHPHGNGDQNNPTQNPSSGSGSQSGSGIGLEDRMVYETKHLSLPGPLAAGKPGIKPLHGNDGQNNPSQDPSGNGSGSGSDIGLEDRMVYETKHLPPPGPLTAGKPGIKPLHGNDGQNNPSQDPSGSGSGSDIGLEDRMVYQTKHLPPPGPLTAGKPGIKPLHGNDGQNNPSQDPSGSGSGSGSDIGLQDSLVYETKHPLQPGPLTAGKPAVKPPHVIYVNDGQNNPPLDPSSGSGSGTESGTDLQVDVAYDPKHPLPLLPPPGANHPPPPCLPPSGLGSTPDAGSAYVYDLNHPSTFSSGYGTESDLESPVGIEYDSKNPPLPCPPPAAPHPHGPKPSSSSSQQIFPQKITNDPSNVNGKHENERVSSGSNKVLVGTVVGIVALIAMAALIVAGLIAYRMKASKKYQKLPIIIDEYTDKRPWSKRKHNSNIKMF